VDERKNRFGTVTYVAEFELDERKKVVFRKEIQIGERSKL
jgi:hypothetical protein